MDKAALIERIKKRKPLNMLTRSVDPYDETEANLVSGYIDDVQQRIMLRLYPYTPPTFPDDLDYIVSDVVIALLNRAEADHEGIQTEKVDTFSVTFIDDALAPYFGDIDRYKKILADQEPPDLHKGVIRFL